MVMIANYFAQVGVGIDRTSITKVNSYLKAIETSLRRFQTNVSRTTQINVGMRVDRAGFLKRLKSTFSGTRSVKIDVSISQQSLNAMRSQIRTAINGLMISPVINPRIRQPSPVNQPRGGSGGTGGTTTGTGRGNQSRLTTHNPQRSAPYSPWHNPMMVGGGVGAFMRYGAFSLPLVAGTFGLNALSNKAATLQSQDLMMDVSMGALGQPGESQIYKDFLNNLGDRLGRTTESMTPFFAQMLSGAKGTALEPHLMSGFSSLMEFGSVMGLGTESMKGTIKAFTQMIGKQQIMAEELRGQAAEHLPPVVRMMAEAVTGGDVKKLNKMMEQGQLDPNVHLPMLFEAMRKNAAPFMDQYFKTIQFWQGKAQKNQEDWVKRFLSSGGTNAIVSFYKTWSQIIGDSVPMAERLGRVFERITHGFNAVMLMPGEIMQWFNGTGSEDNFMKAIFGNVQDSDIGMAIERLLKEVGDAFRNEIGSMSEMVKNLTSLLSAMSSMLASALQGISEVISLLNAYDQGGSSKVLWQMRTNANMRQAQELARQQVGPDGTKADFEAATKQNFDFLQSSNPEPTGSTSMNPGQWGSDLAVWSKSAYRDVAALEGGTSNPLNWLQGFTGIGNRPPANDPGSATTGQVMFHQINITTEPFQVNAVVEARTDAEAIRSEMQNALGNWEKSVYSNMLSLNPMAPQ